MTHTHEPGTRADRRDFLRAVGTAAGASLIVPGTSPGAGASAGDETFPDLASRKAAHAKGGVIPPDKTYRTMELSLHVPPEGTFEINLEGVVASARDAGAESLMFYSQDHWGHALYTSDVGVRHPNLKGDFFGHAVALARKHGMSAVAYYSLQFNNQIVLKHPDWAWVNEKGEPQRMRWYIPCLDSPYRQYALGMIDEIFSRYEVDELFLDIFGLQFLWYQGGGPSPFCFCKHTQDAWNKEHPGDPYREGFKTREGWERRYRWHQNRSMTGMLDAIIAAARKHRPKTVIALNGGPESFPDEIQQRVGFLYAEPLNSPSGIALGTAVSLHRYGKGKAVYVGLPVFRSLGAGTRAYWIRQWIPELIRLLAPSPIAELRADPDSEFVHGTFFFDRHKQFVLVQVLDTIAAVAEGEQRPAPKTRIRVNPSKLRVIAARMVWPRAQALPVAHRSGETVIELTDLGMYAAVCLKLA